MTESRSAIVYTSKGGTTQRVAEQLREVVPGTSWVFELEEFLKETPASFNFLFLGSPTYGLGELDYRWKKFLRTLDFDALRRSSTKVALFVLGDQKWHGRTFAGSLVDFAQPFIESDVDLQGSWPAAEYDFIASPAVDKWGEFPGLVIDEISQPELTSERLATWTAAVVGSSTRKSHHDRPTN